MTTNVIGQPIVNLPNEYANGGQISFASTTTLSIGAGQFRDSTNTWDITTPASTLNSANTGLNGIDTGTVANSTLYYIYAITTAYPGIPGASGYIMSTSATGPVMPFQYVAFRLVGYWFTDGSAHFVNGYNVGYGNDRSFFYDTGVSVLSAGTATTLTLVDLSSAMPAISGRVFLSGSYTPNTAGDSVSLVPGSSTASSGLSTLSGVVAAKAQIANISVVSAVVSSKAQIKYINSAASGATTLIVLGYSYTI